MSQPSPLRFIKRGFLFQRWEGDEAKRIPVITRGLYVLYKKGEHPPHKKKVRDVVYIGIAGVGKTPKQGIRERLRHHAKSDSKKGIWTHYSAFEVHDNITPEEIRELEDLLLHIFRYDSRIKIVNDQRGSKQLKKVCHSEMWPKRPEN